MKVDLGSHHAGLIWVLLVGMLLLSCEPPRAVPPNMPNAEERAQATRNRLRAFNAARFEQERQDVDAAAHTHAPEAVGLPGGMWLSLDEGGPRMFPAPPEAGDRVQWTWVAQNLDGDTLTSGAEDFLVEKDALPLCFHEVAKSTPWLGQGRFWTTSTTAFGASGIPGEVPPFTALEIHFTQRRPVLDASWLAEVQQGTFEEEVWLKAFLEEAAPGAARLPALPVWVDCIECGSSAPAERAMRLDILTLDAQAILEGDQGKESTMEWGRGTPDQLVPALEQALLSHPRAEVLTVWTTSEHAFQRKGVPGAGVRPRTPVRFDVQVSPVW